MNNERIKKIIDSPGEYDGSKEDTYLEIAREFFDRKNRTSVIIFFAHFFFFLALAILSGILFLITDRTKYQIMYAALFVCFVLISYLIKIFGCVMGSKNSIQRGIKKLEIRPLQSLRRRQSTSRRLL